MLKYLLNATSSKQSRDSPPPPETPQQLAMAQQEPDGSFTLTMEDLVNENGPTGGGGVYPPDSPDAISDGVDNNGQPVMEQPVQDGIQDAPQAAAEAADPDPLDRFTEAEHVDWKVDRNGDHPELGPGYGDHVDTPVWVVFDGVDWLLKVFVTWRANWSLKRLLQEAVRQAKDELRYELEQGLGPVRSRGIQSGETIDGWHAPHGGGPDRIDLDLCVTEGRVKVLAHRRVWYCTALDG